MLMPKTQKAQNKEPKKEKEKEKRTQMDSGHDFFFPRGS
jgi:hypothetical protein